MLKSHEKVIFPDSARKHKLYAEVNWQEENENTNDCKVIKFTCPNGEEVFVERKYLMEFIFAIGNAEEQKKLIPQKNTRVRWYETVISVKAKKDIRKNENITFPLKISLPSVEEEVIGELAKTQKVKKALKDNLIIKHA